MTFNKKLAVFVVLMVITIFVWIPKGKKLKGVSASTSSDTIAPEIPVINTNSRNMTKCTDWGRDPFASLIKEEDDDGVSDFKLGCIAWSNGKGIAFINKSILHVGDKIEDKIVKRIENNRVILTDGTKDYTLMLNE